MTAACHGREEAAASLLLLLMLASCCSAASPGPQASAAHARQLQECYNAPYNATPTTFEDFLRNRNTSTATLFLHRVFWSSKPPALELTVACGLNPSRLEALEAQCASWKGPLAAAVYLPVLRPAGDDATAQRSRGRVQQLEGDLEALVKRTEAAEGGCQLTVLLLYEVVADELVAAILPINTLRNAAVLAARTRLLAMVDVDLMLSASASREMADPRRAQEVANLCGRRKALIMPAFETSKALTLERGREVADSAIQGSKPELAQLVRSGLLHGFALNIYARGHAPTNFTRWLDGASGAGAQDAYYPVPYEVNYEPWFIIERRQSPPYDIRFRGYGWNKVQQVALVNASGFQLLVHPSAFLVHRPHPRSEAQAIYSVASTGATQGAFGGAAGDGRGGESATGRGAPVSKLFLRKVSDLRHRTLRDMRRGSYTPIVDQQSMHCRQVLGWWS